MSEPRPLKPPGYRFLPSPAYFIAGFVLGLALLAWRGRVAARTDYHPDFVRFHPAISPEANYYPTVDEMCAIVRARCRPDQVLVIVGGNSILLGVWQPATEVWTKRLQEDLGDRFAVVNLAFRGSSPPDCGAVVAEVLRNEFPRQIYIADEAPITAEDPIGSDVYRFAFWQAYLRGRLLPFPPRDARVRTYLSRPDHRTEGIEWRVREGADRVLHFQDFWNRVGFEDFFTIPALYSMMPPKLFWPRKDFPDTEPDAADPANVAARFPEANAALETRIITTGPRLAYTRSGNGAWTLLPAYREDLLRSYAQGFPDSLKARTLMLISRSCPHYTPMMTPDDVARVDAAFADTVAMWKQSGYDAMQNGRDYTDDDYGDRTHLSKLGGRKLATAVATEVQAMSARLGYLK